MPVGFSVNRFEFPRSLTAHSEGPQPLQKTAYALSVQEHHWGLFCETGATVRPSVKHTGAVPSAEALEHISFFIRVAWKLTPFIIMPDWVVFFPRWPSLSFYCLVA